MTSKRGLLLQYRTFLFFLTFDYMKGTYLVLFMRCVNLNTLTKILLMISFYLDFVKFLGRYLGFFLIQICIRTEKYFITSKELVAEFVKGTHLYMNMQRPFT